MNRRLGVGGVTATVGVISERLGQDFERDVALELGIARSKHTTAALAE
jgi:hypothetical protein